MPEMLCTKSERKRQTTNTLVRDARQHECVGASPYRPQLSAEEDSLAVMATPARLPYTQGSKSNGEDVNEEEGDHETAQAASEHRNLRGVGLQEHATRTMRDLQ